MRQSHDELTKRDAVVLAIGPDPAVAFKLKWAKEQFPFAGLPDPGHRVADQYGQEVSLFKLGRMPAVIIVDKEGVIRFVHYADNMRHYPRMEKLYAVLDGLREEKQEWDAVE